MQRVDPVIGVAAAALIVVATAACSTAPRTALEAAASVTGVPETATIAASYPPPAERAEIPPPASSPQALWRSGYWTWNGVKYVWCGVTMSSAEIRLSDSRFSAAATTEAHNV